MEADQQEALAWLVAEHANLLATLAEARRAGFDPAAWQLAWAISTYLDRQAHWRDWLHAFQHALAEKAQAHADTVMPGLTHLQTAQPVTFGHHLLAYVEMISRDRGRFADARRRLNESPLGAAALAGTSFPIDRDLTARALGFDRPMANSLDAVSDRDFVLETLSAAAIAPRRPGERPWPRWS